MFEDVKYKITYGAIDGSPEKTHMELEIRKGKEYIADYFDVDKLEEHIASLQETLEEMKNIEMEFKLNNF